MPADLQIVHVSSAVEAARLRDAGYCPIECSFGTTSVVDELQMDHHGELSALEPVSLRAYRDHYCARQVDPRFVVTGAADADATMAVAALAGSLPETPAILDLAKTVARSDMNPVAERWEESAAGLRLLAFKQATLKSLHNSDSFIRAVDLWPKLATELRVGELAAIQQRERHRVRLARQVGHVLLHREVAFVESAIWGWDVWYAGVAPAIVAFQADTGRCSIGCRDEASAARLFGPAGLLAVAEKLQPRGWGGRRAIIGSPRENPVTQGQALEAARTTVSAIGPFEGKAHET